MSRKPVAGLLRNLIILVLIPLLVIGCSSDNQSAHTLTEKATTAPASGDASSDHPPTSADSAADKPVPTGPAATMYPTMESSFDSDGDGFMMKDELRKAIDTRFNEFSWPSGYATNLELLLEINTSQVPENAVYENGSEYTVLGFPHMCAWG